MNIINKPIRNSNLDLLRGIAVVIMIFANSAPYVLTASSPPLLLRMVFSCAAPVFVFLSGYSLNLALQNHKPITELYKRAVQILCIAITIDVLIWNIVPFETFDVLYLIGISQIALIGIHPLSHKLKWVLFIGFLVFYFVLTNKVNYRLDLTEHEIMNFSFVNFSLGSSIKRMLYDGWFPLLPWFLISLLGYLVSNSGIVIKKIIGFGLGTTLLFVSFLIYQLFPNFINPPRDKYLELFYPFNIPYFILISGLFLIAIVLIKIKIIRVPLLNQFGKMSLFAYLTHVLLINFLVPKINFASTTKYLTFGLIGLLLTFLVFLVINAINKLKPFLNKNFILKTIRFILGL